MIRMASRRTPRESKEVSIPVLKSPNKLRSEGSVSLWTIFSPHPGQQQPKKSSSLETKPASGELRAPEQTLTLLALRLAVLEKLATGLGKLAFIWATVVLLGGYVSSLSVFDFWVISGLLLTEGTRVFSRSKELEWQQINSSSGSTLRLLSKSTSAVKIAFSGILHRQSSRSGSTHIADQQEVMHGAGRVEPSPLKAKTGGPVAKRIWSTGAVPFIPYAKFFPAKTMSTLLYFLQLGSAGVSIGFSVARLSKQDYGTNSDNGNRNSALNLFYALMLAEASVFLLERAYWEFKLRWRKLLAEVNRRCELDQDDLETVKLFFYTVHSKCLSGSVFDGLDVDLVGFSIEKIQSSVREEQLGSINILSTLVSKGMSREETRRRIGTTPTVIERLLEMITWKDTSEREISKAAAWVLYNLIRHQSNCFRVSATPGALEGIISLLLPEEEEQGNNDMKLLGLTILKQLAKDHRSCIRIGNTGGLISILVGFIEVKEAPELKKHTLQWKVLKKSLQLLKMMADTGGESGHSLRKRIGSMVFAVRNLKDILQLGESQVRLHGLAVDVLTGLANEDELRESIGATGAVIPNLLSLFMKETVEGSDEFIVSMKAGEAVNLLVLQSPKNCSRLLNHNRYKERDGTSQILMGLIRMLFMHPQKGSRAAKILRSLCRELNDKERMELGAAIPGVTKMVMELKGKEQEAAIGLTAFAIPFLDKHAFDAIFSSVHQKTMLVAKMIELVSKPAPTSSLIRIRRYSVELVSALMLKDAFFLQAFRRDGRMERHLERMLDTVSDVENFYTFSGTMGLTRHLHNLEDLINATLLNLRTL